MDAARISEIMADAANLPGARPGALEDVPPPELPTLVEVPPEGDAWLHEIKIDGYRLFCRLDRGDVVLKSRRDRSLTERFPHIARAARELPLHAALFDGEVAMIGPDGRSSFGALQAAIGHDTRQALYFAFDLLHLSGTNLCHTPLLERKRLLERLLPESGPIRFTPHFMGGGPRVFEEACHLGLEGIVSKRCDARYRGGRSRAWLKAKCVKEAHLVVVGYTISGARPFGALLLGAHDEAGRLHYAGRVGAGFTEADQKNITRVLAATGRPESPLVGVGPSRSRFLRWVEPLLVVDVKFTEWTEDGRLRHPVFLRARPDLDAAEVKMVTAR